MARRLSNDGPEEWIIRTIDRSLPAVFPIANATIMTWEAGEGDKITARDFIGQNYDERFSEIDKQVATTIRYENNQYQLDHCAYYQNKTGECGLCNSLNIAGGRKPGGCVVRSAARKPIGDKPK